MDILHLRYFLTMAEMLNYTRAAEQLYISRQALRQSMAAMEKEFGVALFHNERNKLTLTEAGEYLLVTGREIVPRFDEMMEGMHRIAKQEIELTVAMSGSLFPFMMPEADGMIKRFQARHPSVRLKIRPMTNDQVMEALERGGHRLWLCDPDALPPTGDPHGDHHHLPNGDQLWPVPPAGGSGNHRFRGSAGISLPGHGQYGTDHAAGL